MKLSTFKLSLCASLLVHGIAFSIAKAIHPGGGAGPPSSTINQVVELEITQASRGDEELMSQAPPETLINKPPSIPNAELMDDLAPLIASQPELEQISNTAIERIKDVASLETRELNSQEEVPQLVSGDQVVSKTEQGTGVCRSSASVSHLIKPQYPTEARKKRQEGLVILNVVVSESGFPNKVEVAQSSKFVLLDKAAVTAVKQWRFNPDRIGNVPIVSLVEIPVRFQLIN